MRRKNVYAGIAFIIAVSLFMSTPLVVATAAFTDTKTHWGNAQIQGSINTSLTEYSNDLKTDVDITFKDLDVPWATESIKKVALLGILNGYTDGSFKPRNQLTKAELLKVIALTFDISPKKESDPSQKSVPWYLPYKTDLTEAGILVEGDLKGDLSKPATRNELASLAVRAFDTSYRNKNLTSKELMFRAVNLGIMSRVGTKADTVQPEGTTTRAQVAVVITRLLELKSGKTLNVDNGASSAAEVDWHNHNFITMFNQNDLVTFPFKTPKWSNDYEVTIDQLVVLDPSDAEGMYAEYLKGATYAIDGNVSTANEGYLFAYKLKLKNTTTNSVKLKVSGSLSMRTEDGKGTVFLADKFRFSDGLHLDRGGLYVNMGYVNFSKIGVTQYGYYYVYVSKKSVEATIAMYGGFPLHIANPSNNNTKIYLTGVKDIWA